MLLDDRRTRLYLGTLDWNGDGVADLAVLKGGLHVMVNKAGRGSGEFHPPVHVKLPQPQGYLLSVSAIDWNRDGDEDLLYLSAAGDFCFAERSFLRMGCRVAERLTIEARRD